MKKQSKKIKIWPKHKIITTTALAGLVALVLTGVYLAYAKVSYYNDAANQAGIVSVREMVLLAVRSLKKDAPVEPRTGDVYFPESRLYLPNPGRLLSITYVYDKGDATDSPSELSVSTYPVRGTQALYSARNAEELFAAVPKLQACSRGVKLVYAKFPQSDTQNVLKHTVKLDDGQDLYIYLEKACPELSRTADLFKDIRAY